MPDSFKLKTIRTTITLGKGTFGGGGNSKIIEGLATDVDITKPGLPEKNSASVSIANISLADMEQMTFLAFQPLQSLKNLITIEAGEQGKTLATVFKGEITSAYADYGSVPDVEFKIEALSGGYAAQIGAKPISVKGNAKAADLIKQFAKEIGYTFKNEGVAASVRNAVFNGSPIEKARSVADEVGAELLIDDDSMILMPYDKPRSGGAVLLTPETGLIGYPSFTSDGISFSCFFNPNLKQGGQVKIESIVPRASGYWKITKLSHRLTAYRTGGGSWYSSVDAAYIGGG
jgi:hypothetical protein